MQLTSRQKEITRIVRENGPITGEMIAERLHVTRSALRGDLAVLLSGEVIAARRENLNSTCSAVIGLSESTLNSAA